MISRITRLGVRSWALASLGPMLALASKAGASGVSILLHGVRADHTRAVVEVTPNGVQQVVRGLLVGDDYIPASFIDKRKNRVFLVRNHLKCRLEFWKKSGTWRRALVRPCPDGIAAAVYDGRFDRIFLSDDYGRPAILQFRNGTWKAAFSKTGKVGIPSSLAAEYFPNESMLCAAGSEANAGSNLGGVVSVLKLKKGARPVLFWEAVSQSMVMALPSCLPSQLLAISSEGEIYRLTIHTDGTLGKPNRVSERHGSILSPSIQYSAVAGRVFALTRGGSFLTFAEDKAGRITWNNLPRLDHVKDPFAIRLDETGSTLCILGSTNWALYRVGAHNLTMFAEGTAQPGTRFTDCFGVFQE